MVNHDWPPTKKPGEEDAVDPLEDGSFMVFDGMKDTFSSEKPVGEGGESVSLSGNHHFDALEKGEQVGTKRAPSNNYEYFLSTKEELVAEEQKFEVPWITERPSTKEEILFELKKLMEKAEKITHDIVLNPQEYMLLGGAEKKGVEVDLEDRDRLDEILDIYKKILAIKESPLGFSDLQLDQIIERLENCAGYFEQHNLVGSGYDKIGKVEVEMDG